MRLDFTKISLLAAYAVLSGCVAKTDLSVIQATFEPSNLDAVPLSFVEYRPNDRAPGEPQIVETLKIQSGKIILAPQNKISILNRDLYGIVVLKKDVKSNKPFCEALVNNLQFISEGMRLGLAVDGGYAFRNTIIYDARPSGELDKIERPPQLTKDDCDE